MGIFDPEKGKRFPLFEISIHLMTLNNRQLSLEKQLERLLMLSELGKTFTSSMDLDQLQQSILQKTTEILQPESWHLLFKVPEQELLEYKILINDAYVDRTKPIRLGEGISGWVGKEVVSILICADLPKRMRELIPRNILADANNQSIICAPLHIQDKLLGVISLKHSSENFFNLEDLRILSTIADFAAIAFENATNYQRVKEMTIRDDLTALYNQRYLHQILDHEVERARRYYKELSVVFIDLDKFKQVNDKHGHVHGSALLKETAEVILQNTRNIDYCARYGGDEFTIVLPETGKADGLISAERMRSAIEKHVFLKEDGINAKFTASFGVATFPEDAQSKADLIKMADEAMYDAKHKNRNVVLGYTKKNST